MTPHNETPFLAGNGGSEIQVVCRASEYPFRPFDAMAFATSIVAQRRRVSPVIARLVCELAHLGGRRA
jgi:hypothetical protein